MDAAHSRQLRQHPRFVARELEFNEVVYDSEVNDNLRNRAISKEATTVYTKQCSVNVNSHDRAVMGSVLGNGGTNPINGKQIIDAANAPLYFSSNGNCRTVR